ncbi:MAG: peptidase M3 [Rhizobiales bacterium 65-9]|nr:M3 family metallopeptidase [Hyphomicrobiales bacterium]OJY36457.1 MAG: peptidase M3 [Rhizobiales bacterium 65-9]
MTSDNPLLQPWTAPFETPPFDSVSSGHYAPAFDEALRAHNSEIDAIARNGEPASFSNTIDALERSGHLLDRVSSVFFNLASAHTDDALQAIERDMAPKLAAHWSAISMRGDLFRRVDEIFAARGSLGLTSEQMRALEKSHRGFVRAGAKLDDAGKARMAAIVKRLAELGTRFSQNVLKDESAWTLTLEAGDLAGLPEALVAAAAQTAVERGQPGKHMITLSRSSVEPFLQFSARRDLREQAFRAWTMRGQNGGETDNRAIVAETLALRAERARLLGFPTFAHFKLDDTMAKRPEAARALLESVWTPGVSRARDEEQALATLARAEGQGDAIRPWDWRYYAEKMRKQTHDLNESEIKPYLKLDNIIAAAFDAAARLFGLRFAERVDLPKYHPDIRFWEVKTEDGKPVGLFIGDYFARPSKRSGAWMSAFRSQEKLAGDIRPIIVNVMNFAKGDPALLSLDDAHTLFHEFGHALHGLLSDVTYPSLAGTSVARDFVELPSQLYEHWFLRPETLERFALHHETGRPMPPALIDRIIAAKAFNQGFATVEYCSSALVDLAFHLTDGSQPIDPIAFEAAELKRIGMPAAIAMRHRTPHFSHIFSGDGYSAGYYSYLWSETLDADAFDAFVEAGDIFDRETALRLKQFIYSAGDSRDPAELYVAFRGRMPSIEPLLVKRGLASGKAD